MFFSNKSIDDRIRSRSIHSATDSSKSEWAAGRQIHRQQDRFVTGFGDRLCARFGTRLCVRFGLRFDARFGDGFQVSFR